jgi:hypothetical protein
MNSAELDNLVRIGSMKAEPAGEEELAGLWHSGRMRLADAMRGDLSYESRFDLAYSASHALSLAALRRCGYRSAQRHLVFSALVHSLGLPSSVWRVLLKAHERRNVAEYEGHLERDDRLLTDLIAATQIVLNALVALGFSDETPR